MKQATVKEIDWRTALDASPACENPTGCNRPAAERICWTCHCVNLACRPCCDQTVADLSRALLSGTTEFECAACGEPITAHRLSELLRVVPL